MVDRNYELETNQAVLSTKLAQIEEDYQISRSQVLAYKKQVDFYKRELEDERRRAQVLQEKIQGHEQERDRVCQDMPQPKVDYYFQALVISCSFVVS